MFHAHAGTKVITQKNSELYDETSGAVWQLAVYDGAHDGWQFINLGGERILKSMSDRARLTVGKSVLEFCCGQGATCLYLAERYGCEVTGVEMNSRQVKRAREHLLQSPFGLAKRVQIIEQDVLEWQPSRFYDAVISLDSLMLIANLSRVISNAYLNLRPGGLFMSATINAGPHINDEIRRFAWEMDGMISLPTAEDYAGYLKHANFEEIEIEDFTDLAVESSLKIAAALEKNRDEVVLKEGEEAYRGWLEVGRIYVSAFLERKLTYQLIAGRRPTLA